MHPASGGSSAGNEWHQATRQRFYCEMRKQSTLWVKGAPKPQPETKRFVGVCKAGFHLLTISSSHHGKHPSSKKQILGKPGTECFCCSWIQHSSLFPSGLCISCPLGWNTFSFSSPVLHFCNSLLHVYRCCLHVCLCTTCPEKDRTGSHRLL